MNHATAVAIRRPAFHEALERLRVRRGWSFRELAERVGVSKAEVHAWCTGEGIPMPPQFSRLRNVCFRELAPYREQLEVQWDRAGGDDFSDAFTAGEPDAAQMERAKRELDAEVAQPAPPLPEQAPTFGEALRRARVIEGLSQLELGEMLLVTSQAVGQWEHENNAPVRKLYDQLLDLFPVLRRCPAPTTLDIPVPDGGRGDSRADSGGGEQPALHTQVPRLVVGSRVDLRPPGVPLTFSKPAFPAMELKKDPTPLESAASAHAAALVELARARAAAAPLQDAVQAALVALDQAKARAVAAFEAIAIAEDNAHHALTALQDAAAKEASKP
jgi:transcriptional regulator with XRE-family HTH domain